jgi:D-alanine-D-alanine ligase
MSEPLIWAFIPYFNDKGRLDGDTFESETTKAELAKAFQALGLAWIWQPVVLGNVDHVVAQVSRYRQRHPAIVFNFCDGLDADGSPGPSVVRALEAAGIPFTGANSEFYEISCSKLRMKELFRAAGVPTPPYEILADAGPLTGVCDRIGKPGMVKPEFGAASVGIKLSSRVYTDAATEMRRDALKNGELRRHGTRGRVYIERFVEGREFTVFVIGDYRRPSEVRSLPPTERVFNETLPPDERFISWEQYWADNPKGSDAAIHFKYASVESPIAPEVSAIASRAYCAVRGVSYGRVDIRMERSTGEMQVLEVNANPEVTDEPQTATGHILKIAGMKFPALLKTILEETMVLVR